MKKGKKKDVLTLIEGDIINSKLINDFRKLGINVDMYCTDSSSVIFGMLGINKPTDELFERYFEMLRLGNEIDFLNSRKEIKRVTERIYNTLLRTHEVIFFNSSR